MRLRSSGLAALLAGVLLTGVLMPCPDRTPRAPAPAADHAATGHDASLPCHGEAPASLAAPCPCGCGTGPLEVVSPRTLGGALPSPSPQLLAPGDHPATAGAEPRLAATPPPTLDHVPRAA